MTIIYQWATVGIFQHQLIVRSYPPFRVLLMCGNCLFIYRIIIFQG